MKIDLSAAAEESGASSGTAVDVGQGPRTAGATLLEVEDLAVEFRSDDGAVRAVDGLSYRVEAGRTLALVGESGCGKSVSSLAVMGLLPPTARVVRGAARYRGTDLLGL
ncbi:MAG: ATP-binding cassette domain-containing protein, partial [Pseudonocardia sp.]